jgi:hypothetical protein
LIVTPSYYKNATNKGTPVGQPRTMKTNQVRMEAEIQTEIRANNEKFEVLRSTLVSLMDIRQARKMYGHQERMGARMNCRRKDLTACQEATEACLKSKDPTSVGLSPRRSIKKSPRKRPQ